MQDSSQKISSQGKIQGFNKTIQWRHRILVIILSAIFYFLDKNFALAFFLGSLCFHIYYMMLGFSFWTLSYTVPKTDENLDESANTEQLKKESSKIQPIATFISAIRMAAIALALAILILKLKLSLKGIILAFLAYKIVLLVSGFLDAMGSRSKSK